MGPIPAPDSDRPPTDPADGRHLEGQRSGQDDPAIRPEVIDSRSRLRVELGDINDPRFLAYFHAGPLPDPMILRAYEDLLPGSAKLFFKNYGEQGPHRRELETKVVEAGINLQNRGMICGTILAGMAIAGGCLVAILVGTTAAIGGGMTLASTAAISLAVAFNESKKRQANEGDKKVQISGNVKSGKAEAVQPTTRSGEPDSSPANAT